VAGIGEAAWAAAVRHIAGVRDSDFRLLSGPVVGSWLKLTLARRPGRPIPVLQARLPIHPKADRHGRLWLLANHFVGAVQKILRYFETELPCHVQVDPEVKLGTLFDR